MMKYRMQMGERFKGGKSVVGKVNQYPDRSWIIHSHLGCVHVGSSSTAHLCNIQLSLTPSSFTKTLMYLFAHV